MNDNKSPPAIIAIRVIAPFALGYFLSYTYRTVNAVIAPDLQADLLLDAGTLGLLTSAYFLSFAAFQLPLGILLDHYGPRKVETILLLFAALGSFLFAIAESVPSLVAARALIGFGVSACLMASFKAYVMWFPKDKLPFINGLQLMAGGAGALAATQPVEALLEVTDWRGVFFLLAAVTVVSAAAIFFVVPDGRHKPGHTTINDTIKGVGEVFSSALFWRVAPLTVASQAVFLSLQSLWSGPWLGDVAGLERERVAFSLLLIAGSMIAGFFFWGLLAERLGKIYRVRAMTVSLYGMAAFVLVQGFIILGGGAHGVPAWMAFGFFGTSGILPYAALSQSFSHHLAGRVNTGINLLVFVSAFAGQWMVGEVIDLWPRTPDGGYSPIGYQWGFSILLAIQLVSLGWYLGFHKGGKTAAPGGDGGNGEKPV